MLQVNEEERKMKERGRDIRNGKQRDEEIRGKDELRIRKQREGDERKGGRKSE